MEPLAAWPFEFVPAIVAAEWPEWFRWVVLGWLTFVGASFGSFLNVVIYRVPAGLSVVSPGSRCPRCLHAIRPFDNVPVLSWLALRGKCRDCGLPISARYPAVESAVALATVLVALAELFPLDWFPLACRPTGRAPLDGAIGWLGFGFHLLVLLTMFSAAMIEFDGHAPPVKLFFPAFLVGLFVAAAYPETGNLYPLGPQRDLPPSVTGLVAGLVGAGLGSFVGRFVSIDEQAARRRLALALLFATCGFAWGPTVTLAAAFATLVVMVTSRSRGAQRDGGAPSGRFPSLGAALLVSLALSVAARWYVPDSHAPAANKSPGADRQPAAQAR